MNEIDKELLIKDLCARLPYGVKCYIKESNKINELIDVSKYENDILFAFSNHIDVCPIRVYISTIKPYLFPMSSMTEEQRNECRQITSNSSPFNDNLKLADWFNAHHFDYRGLINKGLAIDATNLNIY